MTIPDSSPSPAAPALAADGRPIAPVLVLSTGRCGSTMVSDILNRHPQVLSLSEFFSTVGMKPFLRRRVSGRYLWRLYSRHDARMRLALQRDFPELLYPVDDPGARFNRQTAPPLALITLPHLTAEYEALYDELEAVTLGQPRQTPAQHFRHLFGWLQQRLGRPGVWVERSGGSLIFCNKLLQAFPDARIIHVYRDGRETALSMNRHHLFRTTMAGLVGGRRLGLDLRRRLSDPRRENFNLWVSTLAQRVLRAEWLPYDKVTLRDFGAFWSALMEKAERSFGHYPPDRRLDLRFEDMQADPEGQLRRLIRFIDPSLEDESWLREVVSIPRPTPSRFAELPAAEQEALNEVCRPGLERMGYTV